VGTDHGDRATRSGCCAVRLRPNTSGGNSPDEAASRRAIDCAGDESPGITTIYMFFGADGDDYLRPGYYSMLNIGHFMTVVDHGIIVWVLASPIFAALRGASWDTNVY